MNGYRKFCHSFMITLIMLAVALLPGLTQTSNNTRSSVEDGEQLVANWLQTHHPHDGAAWHRHPHLKDITPQNAWARLGAQVFKQRDFTESVNEVDAFLIKKRQVYPLSIGFGGSGLTSMCACDLNQDSKLELAYTYSWGSGIHRSHLAVLFADQPALGKVETDFTYRGDLQLEKVNDQTVKVYIVPFLSESKQIKRILLGRLVLTRKGKQLMLGVAFDPKLPKHWRNGIWKTQQ